MRQVSVVIVVGFFGRPPFPQDKPCLQIMEMAGTHLLHRCRLVIELTHFGGIIAPSDSAELDFRLLARCLWGPGSVKPDCVAGQRPDNNLKRACSST